MNYWPDDKHITDHREGPDFWMKWIKIASILGWIMVGTIIVMFDQARPQIYSILDMHYNKISTTTWNQDILMGTFILSICTFVFILISLLANAQRLKRKVDRVRISLVVTMFISLGFMLGLFIWYLGTL
ncbi:conserved membrane protein of unknown function [Petrocella atlantisensis]|uniref:Uncharacterized protein n=1 Tax=Petrocella atlantisensis TaxID=2173034 RepID=A0A3P7PFE8_9FIRM|nr:hypothetical protein [Petrocella atlantisensis]PKM56185.1 MAG: hypothetical protein CVV00_00655 [Firmicutes bacterium HGW-Firmicutes-5]VDN48773.1 conserved membrane protein of unknown function [Petrocella atlantisensis]